MLQDLIFYKWCCKSENEGRWTSHLAMVEDLHVVSQTELTHALHSVPQARKWHLYFKGLEGSPQMLSGCWTNYSDRSKWRIGHSWSEFIHVDTHTCILAKVSLNELIPTVANELATTTLCKFVNILESACKHNFGGATCIMSYHYTNITSQFGGFQVVLVTTTPTAPTEGVNTHMEAVNTTPTTTRSSSEGKPLHFPKDCAKAAHCTESHAPYML